MDVEAEGTGHANITQCPLPVGCMVRDALRAPKTFGVLPQSKQGVLVPRRGNRGSREQGDMRTVTRLGPKLAHPPSVINKDRLHYRKGTSSKGLFRKAFHPIISLPAPHTYSFLPRALTEECTFDKAQPSCRTAAREDQLCSQ